MKKLITGILLIAMSLFLTACKKEEKNVVIPVQGAWTFVHPGENKFVQAYTIDETGNTYVVVCEQKEGGVFPWFEMYDVEGKKVFSKEYASMFGKSADINPSMAVREGVLYLITNRAEDESYIELKEEVMAYYGKHGELSEEVLEKAKKASEMENNQTICATLFTYDLESGNIQKVKTFPAFNRVFRMLVGAESLYLLGAKTDVAAVGGESISGRESILHYSFVTEEEVILGIEKPIDIAFNQQENLIIHAEMEEGNCFLEYNAEKNAVKVLASSEETGIQVFAMGEGDSIVYPSKSGKEVIWSEFSELSEGTALYPFAVQNDRNLTCMNGRVICRAENDRLVVVSMADVKKENRYIRFITRGNTLDGAPYSCGYRIERNELELDKMALKVLAMDEDYDLCLIDSRYGFSHNVKENGNFYSLNDLQGIEQYMECCFPYVREAATKEDGSIWMLPIRVNIPLIVYDEAMEGSLDIPFTANMTYETFFMAQEALSGQERALTERLYLDDYFILHYLNRNNTVDTEEFRNVSRLLMEKESLLRESPNSLPFETSYVEGSYIYQEFGMTSPEWIYKNRAEYGENAVAYAYPKSAYTNKNMATCTFFVVNPASDNLEATLQYLEGYIAYMLNQESAPLFFQTFDASADQLDASLYEVYKNGEIVFAVDEELIEGYDEVIAGRRELEEYIWETERKLNIYFHE